MIFRRVDKYTVQCVIRVQEIDQMGYELQDLYSNRERAMDFMRNIIEKGGEAGFHLSDNLQEIQAILLPDHQLILSFTDANPDNLINLTIENIISMYESVNIIGKENLEEILHMKGKEKIQKFNETLAQLQDSEKIFRQSFSSDQSQEPSEQVEAEVAEEEIIEKVIEEVTSESGNFILRFSAFTDLEKFCKNLTFSIPASLFKDGAEYFLLVNAKGLEPTKVDSFVFQAQDFTKDIQRDDLTAAYIEEHAENLIQKESIEVLRRL